VYKRQLIGRANDNFAAIEKYVAANGWIDFLAKVPETRSNTSVCLVISDERVTAMPAEDQAAFAKSLVSKLDKEGIAYDIGAYRDAPAGLRIWTGATVERTDVEALMPWLGWAFEQTLRETRAAA
jgi:phosphoserine aminotransferase